MVGRIESYIHSDRTTPNKGGVLVKVESQTDFAAKTDEFIAFTKVAASKAFAVQATTWDDITAVFPDIESERVALEKKLREKVSVTEITILTL